MNEGLASDINFMKELKLEPGDWYNYLRIDSKAYLEFVKDATHIFMFIQCIVINKYLLYTNICINK
jgi:hypothetical protein